MTDEEKEKKLERDSLLWAECLEQLADQEHQQWAHWTDYMLRTLGKMPDEDGCITCGCKPCETDCPAGRWKRQIETRYEDLSEKEKDSDREWARKTLSVALPYVQRFIQWRLHDIEQELLEAKRAFEDGRPVIVKIGEVEYTQRPVEEHDEGLKREIEDKQFLPKELSLLDVPRRELLKGPGDQSVEEATPTEEEHEKFEEILEHLMSGKRVSGPTMGCQADPPGPPCSVCAKREESRKEFKERFPWASDEPVEVLLQDEVVKRGERIQKLEKENEVLLDKAAYYKESYEEELKMKYHYIQEIKQLEQKCKEHRAEYANLLIREKKLRDVLGWINTNCPDKCGAMAGKALEE